jgi:hypothetical protein
MFLKATPQLSKEGTEELLKELIQPIRNTAALIRQRACVKELKRVLQAKKEQKAQTAKDELACR